MFVKSGHEVHAWALRQYLEPGQVVAVGGIPVTIPAMKVREYMCKIPEWPWTCVLDEEQDPTSKWKTILFVVTHTADICLAEASSALFMPGGPSEGYPLVYADQAKWQLPPNQESARAADCQPAQKDVATICPGLARKSETLPCDVSDSVQSQNHSLVESALPSDSTRGSKHCDLQPYVDAVIDSLISEDEDEIDCQGIHPNVYVPWRAPGIDLLMLMCPCLQEAYDAESRHVPVTARLQDG
ncbi:hypothetical protein FKM82_031193 [Ascaphus truei]